MALYRVLAKSFINDQLYEAGAEIEFAGEPGENLEPLDDPAKAAAQAAADRRASKAAAIVSGIERAGNEELTALITGLVDKVAVLERRLGDVEARPSVDTGGFVTGTDLSALGARVDKLATDVSELDAGLQIVAGRVDEAEGVLAALKNSKPARTPPAPPTDVPPV